MESSARTSHLPLATCYLLLATVRVPASGGAEEVMGLQAADIRDLDISPDGRRIAFSLGAVGRQEIWAMDNFLPSGK